MMQYLCVPVVFLGINGLKYANNQQCWLVLIKYIFLFARC